MKLSLAFLLVATGLPLHAAGNLSKPLEALRAVQKEGQGNAEASKAWQEITKADASNLPEVLQGMNGANPLAENWLRAAVGVIAWVIPSPGYPSVIVTLILIGLGLGFVIGSPLNYLMLRLTPAKQSNSALGTLSLVRSIGTTLAPVIMVGFLAHAGGLVQDRLTAQLPSTIKAPELPYAATLQATFDTWKADDRFADAARPPLR